MQDLEDVIGSHIQGLFEAALKVGKFRPTVSLFFGGKPGRIVTQLFGWRDDNEARERFEELEQFVKQESPGAVMIMLEANLSTPSTREAPSRKILVDIQFPDAPRQFEIYEIIRDESDRVKAIHFKGTAPSTAFNGMDVFDTTVH